MSTKTLTPTAPAPVALPADVQAKLDYLRRLEAVGQRHLKAAVTPKDRALTALALAAIQIKIKKMEKPGEVGHDQ